MPGRAALGLLPRLSRAAEAPGVLAPLRAPGALLPVLARQQRASRHGEPGCARARDPSELSGARLRHLHRASVTLAATRSSVLLTPPLLPGGSSRRRPNRPRVRVLRQPSSACARVISRGVTQGLQRHLCAASPQNSARKGLPSPRLAFAESRCARHSTRLSRHETSGRRDLPTASARRGCECRRALASFQDQSSHSRASATPRGTLPSAHPSYRTYCRWLRFIIFDGIYHLFGSRQYPLHYLHRDPITLMVRKEQNLTFATIVDDNMKQLLSGLVRNFQCGPGILEISGRRA